MLYTIYNVTRVQIASETLPFYRSIGEVISEVHLMSDEKVEVFFTYTIQRCFLHELLIVNLLLAFKLKIMLN